MTAFATKTNINRLSNKLLPVFTGKLLPIVVLTIIMVLYSRKLSYHDYGAFQGMWVCCNIFSVIISFGLSSVIFSSQFDYFTAFLRSHRRKIILLYTAGAIAAFSIFYFTANNFSLSTRILIIIFILLQCLCTLTDSLLIKHGRLKIYLSVNFVYSLSFFAIHLYFFYAAFILDRLILCIIGLSLLKAAALLLTRVKRSVSGDPDVAGNIATNWLYIGFNEIVGVVARWLDKIFLLYLLPPAQFAIFFNGAFEIPLFGILISTIESIMLTNISADIYNKTAAKNIFKESFRILSLIAFPLFFLLLTMHREAFAIIFNNRYNASIPVFLVSIFIIPVRITHYGVILQCYGQSKKIAFGSLMDIALSLALMFILYPVMGTPGVALAIVISTYLQAAYYLWQSAILMQVNIRDLVPVNFLLRWWIALSLLYGLLFYVKHYFSNLTALIAACAITGLIISGNLIIYWKKNMMAKDGRF